MAEQKLNSFEQTIKNYLDDYASNDNSFAEKYNNPKKSIQECCKYITQEAKKQKENGSTVVAVKDDEVYGWAVHYYDEENIVIEDNAPKAEVVQAATKTEAEAKAQKPKRGRKPRTTDPVEEKKPEADEVDENIPDTIEIPVF